MSKPPDVKGRLVDRWRESRNGLRLAVEGALRVVRYRLLTLNGTWAGRSLRQRHASFWRRHDRRLRRAFRFRKLLYLLKGRRREAARSRSATYEIVRSVVGPAIAAAAFVAFMAAADRVFYEWLPGVIDPRWPVSTRPGWVEGLRNLLTPARPFDWSAYAGLLGTIAQVTGVFLGLYFTVVSLLASTSYREVPGDIRAVVVQEKFGDLYLRAVAFTGAVALIILGSISLGFDPGTLNGIGLTILGVLAVLSFVNLGFRAFRFFDPEVVATQLIDRILTAARDASTKGYLWEDKAFQRAAQRRAESATHMLESLARITARGERPPDSLARIGELTSALLAVYSEAKHDLRPDSYWYERTVEHASYFTAGLAELDVALTTGMGIMPREKRDRLWLERRLLRILEYILDQLVSSGHYSEANRVVRAAERAGEGLARGYKLESLRLLQGALAQLIPNVFPGGADVQPDIAFEKLALVDTLVMMPGITVVAFGEAVRAVTPAAFRETLLEAISRGPGAPIGAVMSPSVQRHVEFMREALSFEKDVEGERKTPNWFALGHGATAFQEDLVDGFESILSNAERAFPQWAKHLRESGAHDAAVLAVQRGRDMARKLSYQLGAVEETLAKLSTFARDVIEERTAPDRAAITDRLEVLDKRLVNELVAIAPKLPWSPPSEERPDAFGYAVTVLGEQAYLALLEDDVDRFAGIYRTWFVLSLVAHDRVREELRDHSVETQLSYSSELLLDLLEISGYAYLNSALQGSAAWSIVEKIWDYQLKHVDDPGRFVTLVFAADSYHELTFAMSPRSLMRTQWRTKYEGLMRERGFCGGPLDHYGDEVRVVPLDLFAAAFFQHVGFGPDPRHVFLAAFLRHRPESDNPEMSRRVLEVIETTERIAKRRETRQPPPHPLSHFGVGTARGPRKSAEPPVCEPEAEDRSVE